jgi:hypothetical protein
MIRTRPLAGTIVGPVVLAILAFGSSAGALAQPLMLPGALLPGEEAAGATVPPQAGGGPATQPRRRSVLAKTVAEEAVINRDLRLNGTAGMIRIERVGRGDLMAKLRFEGTSLSRPGESCTVTLDQSIELKGRGQTEGLVRYGIQTPACAITADILDGALWVRGPAEACIFEGADCRVDPRGLWGPEPAALTARARGIEQERAQADRAVRENYKALTQRARPQEVRSVVAEQAAFSSEREMMCRGYAREAAHGFCNTRFTEARAAQLAARLGLASAATQIKPPLSLPPSQE